MGAAAAILAVQIPIALHKRAKIVSKRVRTSMTYLVRESLEQRLNEIEARERAEAAAAELAAEPKRKPATVTALDQRPLVEIPIDAPVDRLMPLFEKHANRIMAVSNDPQQVAIRQSEAFAAIRKFAPLTYRDEDKISQRLESLIIAKATMEEETDDAAAVAANPPPIVAHSLRSSAPAVAAPSTDLSSAFALLRQMLTPQGQPVVEDPLAGRMINAAKVRTQSVLGGEDE